MTKGAPVFISLLALVVSAGSLYVSYLSYTRIFILPEVYARLNYFELSNNPIAVSANFDFSVSNRSSQAIFIVNCEVATDGLHTGAGGYGEGFSPCGIGQFESAGGQELAPGQTEFFTVNYTQKLESYEASLALKLMGIDLAEIQSSLVDGPCRVQIAVDRNHSSMNQNCALIKSSLEQRISRTLSQKVSDLVLQTGAGELIRTPVYLSTHQPWPWGT